MHSQHSLKSFGAWVMLGTGFATLLIIGLHVATYPWSFWILLNGSLVDNINLSFDMSKLAASSLDSQITTPAKIQNWTFQIIVSYPFITLQLHPYAII